MSILLHYFYNLETHVILESLCILGFPGLQCIQGKQSLYISINGITFNGSAFNEIVKMKSHTLGPHTEGSIYLKSNNSTESSDGKKGSHNKVSGKESRKSEVKKRKAKTNRTDKIIENNKQMLGRNTSLYTGTYIFV